MASFGQLTNAFLKASQETSIGLAHLNFDFAIVKYDAPQEYLGLGEALSKRRKDAAEDGPLHVTARKLGALFQSAMPEVPNLIQAYGLRASEIAKLPEVNPKASARHGIFAEHMGADGATIWASATSGKETVTMHLLACMLARIWSREEAVSIWSELVEYRKVFLQRTIEGYETGFRVSDLAASRIEISRAQLDAWDASARAWLQTADAGKLLQQTQVRLVVDNIPVPVSTHGTLYNAVIEAWIKALEALENLVKGIPQQINDGAVLLGLSAWHLYPDLLLADTTQYIKQNDSMIRPGGIVTIGLEGKENNGQGVFWSLPLAHARYYGDPVITKRYAGVKESQVTFNEFLFVVIGSALGRWKSHSLDLCTKLDLIQKLARFASPKSDRLGDLKNHPLHTKVRSNLGWLHCLSIAASQYSQSTEVVREQMSRLVSFGERRCSGFLGPVNYHPPPVFGLVHFQNLMNAFGYNIKGKLELLQNWAAREFDPRSLGDAVIRYRPSWQEQFKYVRAMNELATHKKRRNGNNSLTISLPQFRWVPEDYAYHNDMMKGLDDIIPPAPGNPPGLKLICGDPMSCALYVPIESKMVEMNCMEVSHLIRCIEEGDFPADLIKPALHEVCKHHVYNTYFDSLNAIDAAAKIYSKLHGARVDLEVTSKEIIGSHWCKELQSKEPRILRAIFSCVAHLETGVCDVDPNSTGDQTFAVCHGSSIYVAEGLLKDPVEASLEIPVERIVGNVGKPGLTFLITPPNPRIREVDYSTWHMVSHEAFDGKAQDNFHGTSFHLSFTGYELPIDLGHRSGRDAPASFLETAVSVYDRGKWVADLDILKSSTQWTKLSDPQCGHSNEQKTNQEMLRRLVSVDSWMELLDPPVQVSVVRAHGNPVARLAAAALAARQSRRVFILQASPCWTCHLTNIAKHEQPEEEGDSVDEGEDDSEDDIEVLNYEEGDGESYAFNVLPPEGYESDSEDKEGSVHPKTLFIY